MKQEIHELIVLYCFLLLSNKTAMNISCQYSFFHLHLLKQRALVPTTKTLEHINEMQQAFAHTCR